ncbi:MAG: hypothetical protein KAI24_13155 [Planctomycetes bacterium]|nr:hypothetical protein [Planctomycetota bacterium]
MFWLDEAFWHHPRQALRPNGTIDVVRLRPVRTFAPRRGLTISRNGELHLQRGGVAAIVSPRQAARAIGVDLADFDHWLQRYVRQSNGGSRRARRRATDALVEFDRPDAPPPRRTEQDVAPPDQGWWHGGE